MLSINARRSEKRLPRRPFRAGGGIRSRVLFRKHLESIHSGIIGYLLGSRRESIAVAILIGGRSV
ncbi:hypothetical protein JCM9803A_00440 [Rhodococcus erythropolis]